jgi:hypothetical protein
MNRSLKYIVVANLRENSYFSLERRPSLEAALAKVSESVCWVSIYDLVDKFNQNIYLVGDYLKRKTRDRNVLLIHKEMLHYLPMNLLSEISSSGVLVVGFLGDEEWSLDYSSNYLPYFDVSVVYSDAGFKRYSSKGFDVKRLPIGASFNIKNVSFDKKEDIDVLFIGRPYPPRDEIINFLISNGIKISIFGSKDWANLIPKSNYSGYLSNSDYDATLARAKIILGLMEAPSGGAHMNAKIFDASKVGKLVIATRFKPLYDEYKLIEGKSVVTYSSKNDLLEKIKYYLKNKNERDKIAFTLKQHMTFRFDYLKLYSDLLIRLNADFDKKKNKKISASDQAKKRWRFLSSTNDVKYFKGIDRVLSLNCVKNLPLVINTEYKGKVVKKRGLPFADASSVILPEGVKRPLMLFGFVWCPKRISIPPLAMNSINSFDIKLELISILDNLFTKLILIIRRDEKV